VATWIWLAPGLCVASEASAALGSISTLVPIPLTGIVVHTEGYTHAAKVWDLSIVQGPFSVAPCQTLTLRFAPFASLWGGRVGAPQAACR
jgi:hypothetical protein